MLTDQLESPTDSPGLSLRRRIATSETYLGSQSTPEIPALIVYAPLSRIRTGGVVIAEHAYPSEPLNHVQSIDAPRSASFDKQNKAIYTSLL